MTSKKDPKIATAMQQADWHRSATIRLKRVGDPKANLHEQAAVEAEQQIAAQLAVSEPPVLGAGTEVVRVSDANPTGHLRETLANPTALNLEASHRRIELVRDAGVFENAVDAADSIGATDSLQKMLAHQMALSHEKVFEFMNEATKARDPVEKARLANTAARLMSTFQTGMLTLHRVRTGGKQVVVVQHVQVANGGQAIVAGNVEPGGRGAAATGEQKGKT